MLLARSLELSLLIRLKRHLGLLMHHLIHLIGRLWHVRVVTPIVTLVVATLLILLLLVSLNWYLLERLLVRHKVLGIRVERSCWLIESI